MTGGRNGAFSTTRHEPQVTALWRHHVAISGHIDCAGNPVSVRAVMNVLRRWKSPLQPCWFCLLALLVAGRVCAWQMKQAPLMTQWAALVNTNSPFPEYPRPQLVRSNWLNLNGIWQFQSGATNDSVPVGQTLSSEILVPYPMESAISGIMQYHPFSWYRRMFTVPPAWSGKRIILHLDAVDWQSTVYVNGQSVGTHKGGYDALSYDVTPYLTGSGPQELIVRVYNPVDNGGQPRGKQTLYPGGIMYLSSSGIWQSVWLEPVDASGISTLKIIPDLDNSRLRLTVNTYATNGVSVVATALSNGVVVATATGNPQTELNLPVPNPNLWSPENPFLYDLNVSAVHNGTTNDSVTSYFGMRKVSHQPLNGVPQIMLNNQRYFGMGPLDQGFWPDGLYTAPTDAALAYDLVQTKALGFNLVRKHIKVEPQRWYYWADKLGLIVWQDMPSCNSYTGSPKPIDALQFISELTSMVTNHWNSPCIIMWDVFNEGQGQGDTGQTNTTYLCNLVKALDPSRLVNQASGGNYFGAGDILDNHSYPAPGAPTSTTQAPVDGEYGGIGFQMAGHLWNPALAGGNYVGANTTNDIAAIYDSFANNLVVYKSNLGLNAAIYTQTTDVENECNGLLTYDRVLKPSLALIRASNQKAINARIYLTTVLPTSETSGRTWKYTSTAPASNWYATNFNDSAWSSGPAGFGTAGTPGAVVRTTWNTADIWMRQTFTVGTLTPTQRAQLAFNLYHDEDCELYVNGVLAASASGYATTYVMLPLNTAGQNALIANGTNIIAVHCHQTGGGQGIDVGISKLVLVQNALVLPTDFNGYWTLDETNGTAAADSSGTGNNATVSGATWNSNGKVKGCLSFNGVNNYAQLGNGFGDDFSISFWVKTTQSGGTGQWWQGRGLVDSFLAANANDYGTALSGNSFAFGTGNPDTTLVSAVPINDGAWHQCVATREKATGALNIYVDGNWQAAGTGGTNSLKAAPFLRFGSRQSGVNFFNGNLDDIRIYSRALGSNEVTALFLDSATLAPAPASLTAVAGDSQIALEWSAVPVVTGYDLKRSTTSGGPYSSIARLSGTSYTDTGVVNGGTYYYVVAAINALDDGTNSVEASATPDFFTTLKTWFAANAITGLAHGAAVGNWPDLSGNDNDAVQTNSSQKPTYLTNAMNGLPVVRFNAANSSALSFSRPVQDDFTMLCVFRSTQGISSGTQFYQGAGLVNGEVAGVGNDFGVSLNADGKILAGTGNPDTTLASASGYNNGLQHVLTFKRTAGTGGLALYVDGSLVTTGTAGSQPLTAPGRLVLGAQQTLINFLSGDIAELKIYAVALSDTARAAEESALECKYGIPGAITPPPTPTGLTGTADNRSILLSWPASVGATAYNLSWSTSPAGPFSPLVNNLGANNYEDTRAVNGATNYYQLAAVNGCLTSAGAAAVAVFLPKPVLALASAGGGSMTIAWPGWANDWKLIETASLTPPAIWTPVADVVSSNDGQFSVTVPINSGTRYFRLSAP